MLLLSFFKIVWIYFCRTFLFPSFLPFSCDLITLFSVVFRLIFLICMCICFSFFGLKLPWGFDIVIHRNIYIYDYNHTIIYIYIYMIVLSCRFFNCKCINAFLITCVWTLLFSWLLAWYYICVWIIFYL